MSEITFHIAVWPGTVIWEAEEDGAHVYGAYLCGVCDSERAFVVTNGNPPACQWYGYCSICSHTVFLGVLFKDWLPGPSLGEVLACEIA